jgi:hypothetical protein
MRSLAEMTPDELHVAHDAAAALLRFREYAPPGGLLVMLAGKFRDDVRDVLEMEPEPPAYRGRDRRSLDELTSVELDTVAGATGILLDRFAPFMDDPALPRLLTEFRNALSVQKAERVQLQGSIGAS